MTNYDKLLKDLHELYQLAADFEFHDFRNRHFATPKVELVKRLQVVIDKVKIGEYDQDGN